VASDCAANLLRRVSSQNCALANKSSRRAMDNFAHRGYTSFLPGTGAS